MAQPALGTGGTYPCPPTRVYEIGGDRRLLADIAANAPKPVVLSPRWRQFFKKLCSVRRAKEGRCSPPVMPSRSASSPGARKKG